MDKDLKLYSNIVDISLLNECFYGETKLQIEVISIFLTETPIKLEAIHKGISDKNYIKIKENAHYLKSSFGSLGVKLNKQFLEIENLSREKENIKKIEKILKSCELLYLNSMEEYKKILNTLQDSLL